MTTNPTALAWLRVALANSIVDFRDGQWEAIDQLVNQRGRVLCVQRTGWGKSMVYFVSAKLMWEQGAGPTLIISPLLALMRKVLVQRGPLIRESLALQVMRLRNPAERLAWMADQIPALPVRLPMRSETGTIFS